MRDIKPRNNKIATDQKIKRNSQNASDILIKKTVISFLILIFIGVIIFYFVQENKDSKQINIEDSNSEQNSTENTRETVT